MGHATEKKIAPTKKNSPSPDNDRRQAAWICLALAAITFSVFGRTAGFGFVNYDDDLYVYDNPVVAQGLTLKGIAWASTQAHAGNWHPLTWLSHMLDCQFYGLRPGGHHLTNVILHTGAVIALFLVLRELTAALWRSAFVAAVFAIHPLRVESVAWVAERKDVLSGLFFVLTIGAYLRFARRPWSSARYGLVIFLFAMGLMSKPMLVTLPLVLLLLDYWPLQRMEPGKLSWLVMEKLPLLALSAASCVVTLVAQQRAMPSLGFLPLWLRCANALVSCMVYLGQMVWPVGLAVFYPYSHHGLPPWEVGLAALLLAGISVLAFGQRRKRPWLLMGWLWYLAMLLPVVGIIQVGSQAHADRYTYLPQIGIYVAVTWLAADWSAKWRVRPAALAGLMTGVVAVLAICAWKQTAYWKNNYTLWAHALACTGGNYVAHLNFGEALLQLGRADEAINEFQLAAQFRPGDAEARNNLGYALLHLGRTDDAMTQFQKALQINPSQADAHLNLGNALLQKERLDEAIAQYQEALRIKPDYAEACFDLGISFHKQGRLDEAMSYYQKALEIKPGHAEARNNLGHILLQMGRVDEAIAHFQKALQLKPDYAEAHYNLGNALRQMGNLDEAITQYRKALDFKPDDAETHYNLGNALLQKGAADGAITEFQNALRFKPDYVEAHNNLGNLLAQKGNAKEAIAHFQKALQIAPGNPTTLNGLAWLLATCPDASLRNGNKAVELAQQANAATGGADPLILHTLAAAYAEVGRFGDARQSAQKAIALARAAGHKDMAERFNGQLKRYEAGLALHQ